MKALRIGIMAAALAGSLTTGLQAQSEPASEKLITAIDEQKGNDVISLVNDNGSGIINTRAYSGTTALNLAMRKRLLTYVNFFLQNGADPNMGDRTGETALIVAARMGYLEGVNTMLGGKAAVDATNRQGETALIVAVQARQTAVVKRLLEAGASTTKTDNASGLSARDYAVRDRRSSDILKLMDSVKPKPVFKAGPIIQ